MIKFTFEGTREHFKYLADVIKEKAPDCGFRLIREEDGAFY